MTKSYTPNVNLRNTAMSSSDIRLLSAIEELLDRKLDEKLDCRFAQIEQRLDALEKKFDALEKRINALEKKVDTHYQDLSTQIKRINLILENEIRPNISIIVESHLDMSRKLDNAIYKSKESMRKWENLSLRTNYLEAQVRNILSAQPNAF